MKAIRTCLVFLSLAVCIQSAFAQAAASLPKGYLIRAPYPNAKAEINPLESITVTDVYRGTAKDPAGRDIAFSSKLVSNLIALDPDFHASVQAQTKGSGGTFLGPKILFANINATDIGTPLEIEEIKRQKRELDKIIEINKFQKQLGKVSEELGAQIARYEGGERKVGGNWISLAAYEEMNKAAVKPEDTVFSFTTKKGIRYTQVRVTAVNEDSVSLAMKNGMGRVDIEEVPEGAADFPDVWKMEILKVQGKRNQAAELAKAAAAEAAKGAEAAAAPADGAKQPATATAPATPEQQKATPAAQATVVEEKKS